MSEILFKNARIIDPVRQIDAVDSLGVADGVIVAPGKFMYPVGRFATFARVGDDLTCRVASAVTALVSAPWIVLIPISL